MENSNEQKVYDLLNELGVPYQKIDHPAVYTCEQAALYCEGSGAAHTKNLFLTNADKSGFFLAVMEASKKLRAKDLGRALGEKGLTFASSGDMLRLLGITSGAVSPFGLINDSAGVVTVILDREIETCEKVSFHPNVNTSSVVLETKGFLKTLRHFGNRLVSLDL
jgi:Ala-tRNA(Pro) deacylase